MLKLNVWNVPNIYVLFKLFILDVYFSKYTSFSDFLNKVNVKTVFIEFKGKNVKPKSAQLVIIILVQILYIHTYIRTWNIYIYSLTISNEL